MTIVSSYSLRSWLSSASRVLPTARSSLAAQPETGFPDAAVVAVIFFAVALLAGLAERAEPLAAARLAGAALVAGDLAVALAFLPSGLLEFAFSAAGFATLTLVGFFGTALLADGAFFCVVVAVGSGALEAGVAFLVTAALLVAAAFLVTAAFLAGAFFAAATRHTPSLIGHPADDRGRQRARGEPP
ncbi:MAG: hypothetical protein WKF51_01355 [Geodermatophilaceae bacterium]